MSYSVRSRMPLLTKFARVDDNNQSNAADIGTNEYHTFTTSKTGNANTYYGFRLRYHFDEDITNVVGLISDQSLNNNQLYLSGAGTESLLSYSTILAGNLPEIGGAFDEFVVDGSLVEPSTGAGSTTSTTWDHLAYLTTEESDFDGETSEHQFGVLADDDYIALPSGGNVGTYPFLFGGYGSDSDNYNGADDATLFFDADGNPARVDSTWYSTSDLSTLEISYDDFGAGKQSFTTGELVTSTHSQVNIFSFLDQLTDDPDTLPGFGVVFSFATALNPDTISINDFDIAIDGVNDNKVELFYSEYNDATGNFDIKSYFYDFDDPSHLHPPRQRHRRRPQLPDNR